MNCSFIAEYYRKELAKRLEDVYGFVSSKLEVPERKRNEFHTGYQLSSYDTEQMDVIENLILLKNIANRRITDVKKITQSELELEFDCYLDYFKKKFEDALSDDKFVMHSILLFTTEIRYHVMSVYMLADKLSTYQNNRSKNKFSDDYLTNMCCFNVMIAFQASETQYLKENSLILSKIDTIKNLTPDNLTKSREAYISDLILCAKVKQLVRNIPEIIEYIRKSSGEERRYFIEKHYPVHTILDAELTWEHKKGKYVRELYGASTPEVEPPKNK